MPEPAVNVLFASATGSVAGGGVTTAMHGLFQELSRKGVDVRLVAFSEQHREALSIHWGGRATFVEPWLRHPKCLRPALHRFLGLRDGVLHVHGLWSQFSVAAAKVATPRIVSPHGMLEGWALRQGRWRKRLALSTFERRNMGGAACIHALNEREALDIRAQGFRKPICIIPNGVEIASCAAASPCWAGRFANKRILLFLGRLHPKKGLAEFLRAFQGASHRAECAAWRLVIAGPDELGHRAQLEEQVQSLALGDRVWFSGPLYGGQKEAALTQADAFVLPSKSEGLPMSVLEAWSHRIPVLMTDACNLGEAFALRAASRLAHPEDVVSVVEFLSQDRTMMLTMAGRGYELVTRKYSWATVSDEFIAVYRWICKGGAQPASVTTD